MTPFWEGFYSVFRNRLMIYAFGFVAGFVVRGFVQVCA